MFLGGIIIVHRAKIIVHRMMNANKMISLRAYKVLVRRNHSSSGEKHNSSDEL